MLQINRSLNMSLRIKKNEKQEKMINACKACEQRMWAAFCDQLLFVVVIVRNNPRRLNLKRKSKDNCLNRKWANHLFLAFDKFRSEMPLMDSFRMEIPKFIFPIIGNKKKKGKCRNKLFLIVYSGN